MKHFESSRPWIATDGKPSRRATTLTFVLERAGRVFFTVKQLSPTCEIVSRFSVRGKKGVNRLRFAGRIGKRELEAGTYEIQARTRTGRVVQKVVLIVVDGPAPSDSELAAARRANVCSASADGFAGLASGGADSALGAPSGIRGALAPGSQSVGDAPTAGAKFPSGGVLATAVEDTARALQPALIILLGAAIILLALASLPTVAVAGDRFNEALVRHRPEIAAVGAAALAAFVVTLFLT